LFNALTIIALLFVVGELAQQIAGKVTACTAMLQTFAFAATFHRAGIAATEALCPKRLVNMYTAPTTHLVPVFALATQNAAP